MYHDVIVHTASGARKYRYLQTANGAWKFLGQVKVEETHDRGDGEKSKPEPKAAPDGEKKAGREVRADTLEATGRRADGRPPHRPRTPAGVTDASRRPGHPAGRIDRPVRRPAPADPSQER